MLRAIKWIILLAIFAVLVIIGVANADLVTLELLPVDIEGYTYQIELPLALVILVSFVVGWIAGEVYEWVREHKHRKTARRKSREAAELEKENQQLKNRLHGDDDMPNIPV